MSATFLRYVQKDIAFRALFLAIIESAVGQGLVQVEHHCFIKICLPLESKFLASYVFLRQRSQRLYQLQRFECVLDHLLLLLAHYSVLVSYRTHSALALLFPENALELHLREVTLRVRPEISRDRRYHIPKLICTLLANRLGLLPLVLKPCWCVQIF